ncbi:hypothetical protein [Neisseria meningitidis]|uniref:hypothetical protein n=1 Tax=Neisseria meningitidis TaxID=487 RepID=UPI00031F8642|nr:hypothetical protein [Neisseria meningitidis]
MGVNRFTRAVQKICRLNGFQTAWLLYSGLTKIRQGDEAADSTNSTEPIHLVLQHLRESSL